MCRWLKGSSTMFFLFSVSCFCSYIFASLCTILLTMFLVTYFLSFGVLSWATETKIIRKEANRQEAKARNRKQRAHCRWALNVNCSRATITNQALVDREGMLILLSASHSMRVSIPITVGRVSLAHIPIAHIHSHRPVLRIFLLDHQSEHLILN